MVERKVLNEGKGGGMEVGMWVRGVGGKGEIKGMKKVGGRLKIEEGEYGEVEGFRKLRGDMEGVSGVRMEKGEKNRGLVVEGE